MIEFLIAIKRSLFWIIGVLCYGQKTEPRDRVAGLFLFSCWMILGVGLFAVNFKERRQYTREERSASLFARMNASAAPADREYKKTA
ncbi:MAG: hypothetical protein ACI3WR_00875 [Oscillospiraceae bacterium]